MESDTIAAPASSLQPAGVAVIRLSGSQVPTVLAQLFKAQTDPLKNPRELCAGCLIDPQTQQVLDHCLAVFFPAPKSFTGEDVAELHLHGSPILVQLVMRTLYQAGVRAAAPGEFSQRAFLSGKMDLTQAEAIADLINANSHAELRVAQSHLAGRLKNIIADIGEPLKDSLAELEAHIDFPEEDINPASLTEIRKRIESCLHQVQNLLSSYNYGRLLKDGLKVLIYGNPNVGKSSLLNYFLREERAIVTPISGTTRDTLEEQALIDGLRVIFCDTAGISATEDPVEKIGVQRAEERLNWADLVLFVNACDAVFDESESLFKKLAQQPVPVWLLVNKIDLQNDFTLPERFNDNSWPIFKVSALNTSGLVELENALVDHIKVGLSDAESSSTVITNERQRACLANAQEALVNCVQAMQHQQPLEIISAELRLGINALAELVGSMSTEDLLGRIFSKFCIGK